MTLPASFPISASQINVELKRSAGAPFDIQGAQERALAEVPSGAISMSDFLGKSFFTAEFLATTSLSYADPLTFPSVGLGAAAATRKIGVNVHWVGTSGVERVLTSATIGGVAATIHGQTSNRNTANNLTYGCAIISADVPTGTTGDIVLDFSGAFSSGTVLLGVYRYVNLASGVIDTHAGRCSFACNATSGNINVPALGVIQTATTGLCSSGTNVTLNAPTPTDYDGADWAGSMLSGQSADPSRSLSASIAGSDCNIGMVSVTWTGY